MSKSLGCHETFEEIFKSVTFQSSDDISTTIENDGTVYSCLNSCETSSDDAIVFASPIDPISNKFRFQENSSVCQSARFHGLVPLEPFQIKKVDYLEGYRPILRNGIESYSSSSGSYAFIINEENSKDFNHFRQKCSKYIDLDNALRTVFMIFSSSRCPTRQGRHELFLDGLFKTLIVKYGIRVIEIQEFMVTMMD